MLGGPGVLKVAQDLWGMNCKLVLQIRLLQNFYRKCSVPLRASLDLSSLSWMEARRYRYGRKLQYSV